MWTTLRALWEWLGGMVSGLVSGLIFGLVSGLVSRLVSGVVSGLISGQVSGCLLVSHSHPPGQFRRDGSHIYLVTRMPSISWWKLMKEWSFCIQYAEAFSSKDSCLNSSEISKTSLSKKQQNSSFVVFSSEWSDLSVFACALIGPCWAVPIQRVNLIRSAVHSSALLVSYLSWECFAWVWSNLINERKYALEDGTVWVVVFLLRLHLHMQSNLIIFSLICLLHRIRCLFFFSILVGKMQFHQESLLVLRNNYIDCLLG